MRKLILLAVAAVVPLLAIAGFAAAGGGQSSLDALREATAGKRNFFHVEFAVVAPHR